MASSYLPHNAQSVTVVTAGTAVAANPQPYDNTTTIVVINPNADPMYVAWGTAGDTLTAANAMIVPPDYGSVTLEIGSLSARPTNGVSVLIIDATTNSHAANLTYINGLTN